ncbi:disulfide bond formation protein [Natrialba hulunbeirensis JCM 10989]|uniref:Disulfide bond formation protein n=1 Tax=Natrialba hulunbeirensis JCM 10989 TaxID=1227493 RepID=L9ZSK3_9EURY|nr:DsbA family protein [Natrialba hulunbeirensis]ELY88158.1 disulfide bond formation protein [Natrialba hulunbeirensis JCM 10989]
MNQTRRAFLGTTTAVGLGVVAGCLGSEDPPEPPVTGNPDADVTVTVYEDFSCPFCRDFKLGVFPELEEQYLEPGDVRYEHRDFPVIDSPWSWEIPSAAREVFESAGNDAFWEFTTEIYAYQGSYNYGAIEGVADEVGADGSAVREAAEDESHRSTIEADRSYGDSNSVGGTPAVFVDGDAVEFYESEDFEAMALEETSAAIDAALE